MRSYLEVCTRLLTFATCSQCSVGLHSSLCFAHRYGSQESEPQELLVMPWGLPRAITCPSALLQPGLCPEKASSSQSSALGQGQQCCTLAPCQEVLGNTPNLYIYFDVFIMGYHSLYLRMGDLRHYPLHWVILERKDCLTLVNFTLVHVPFLTPDGILVKWSKA